MIGNWKSSLILGLIALTLWVVAFSWYLIGNHRIWLAWQRLRGRLGLKPTNAK